MKAFPTFYQEFIYKSRYARWIDAKGRRENWDETINRYLDFMENKVATDHKKGLKAFKKIRPTLFEYIHDLKAMPSMRALSTAGPALERDNMACYNCAYLVVDSMRSFDEAMYVLMCGTGVGFSVERQYVSKLPDIAEEFHETDTTITVHDSKIGWAKAFRELLSLLTVGQVPKWDMSGLRPAGARLKTFGGRSSGPDPLDELFRFCVNTFKAAAGRKLTSLECHDLVCKVGDVVVVGGVRRSALISLSNPSDDRMRGAKTGQWQLENDQRQLANNSACYTEKPDLSVFLKEWMSLYESKSGERGIFSRIAAKKKAAQNGRRDPEHEFGCNPCSEIILRPYQTCNLSEIVVRPKDSLETLKKKAEVAAILGTLQSSMTNFRYVRKIWQKNVEEERLLGVSLTGIMDHDKISSSPEMLATLREHVVAVNKKWAQLLDIPQATATTCTKPSGTVSQLVDSSSGIHTRYSSFYIRTVRCDAKDPLAIFMKEKGFPCEEAIGNPEILVFSFPIKSPKNAATRNDFGAVQQMEIWNRVHSHWCEHKPSMTVYYKDDEFLELGAWVYKNFHKVSGVSFLPHTDHVYKQAPYEEITEDAYSEMLAKMPGKVDWEEFASYENEDNTVGAQEFACSGAACEVVDLVVN
jgi:ribonucleoside-diphosphate reductase alpha chain